MDVVIGLVVLIVGWLVLYHVILPVIAVVGTLLWMFLPAILGILVGAWAAFTVFDRTGRDNIAVIIALVALVLTCSVQTRWSCFIEGTPPRWWWD